MIPSLFFDHTHTHTHTHTPSSMHNQERKKKRLDHSSHTFDMFDMCRDWVRIQIHEK